MGAPSESTAPKRSSRQLPIPFFELSCYLFVFGYLSPEGAFSWNGSPPSTKKSTSIAKLAHTPTLSFNFSLRRDHPLAAVPECA
jgi:hypothetical protein